MDGGAESSVTNNEDLITNLIDSTVILEGFNGAAAKAQGQGELIFSTPCHTTEWFSKDFGKIVPNGDLVLYVDACLSQEASSLLLAKKTCGNLDM